MMMDGTDAIEVMDVILDWANKKFPIRLRPASAIHRLRRPRDLFQTVAPEADREGLFRGRPPTICSWGNDLLSMFAP